MGFPMQTFLTFLDIMSVLFGGYFLGYSLMTLVNSISYNSDTNSLNRIMDSSNGRRYTYPWKARLLLSTPFLVWLVARYLNR